MPALPSSILEPLWVQVAALLPTRQVHHPLGCHGQRIPDRVVFDKLIDLEHGRWTAASPRRPAAARSPGPSRVDRRKQGLKRSLATEAHGVPLAALPAPANRRGDGLLAATLDAAAILTATAIVPLPATPRVHRTPAGRGQVLAAAGLGAHRVGRLIRRAWTDYRWDGRPAASPDHRLAQA